jgi:mRNA turnover protein 4
VTLTKAEKKTREDKERIGDEIRVNAEKYAYTWVFRVENMRNTFLKDIRQDWTGSRIFFGRTKVMQKALGRSPEDESLENLHQLSATMSGEVGLLMTDEEPQVVRDYFDSFVKKDFARAGLVAPLTFTIPEGIVYSTGGQLPAEDDVPLAHSLEATVRLLGMPTQLKAGKVVLSSPYTVCTEGQVLDGKQTRLLKQFGIACAEFKVELVAYYDKESSTTKAGDA